MRLGRTWLCAGLASAACTGCFSSDNGNPAAMDGSPNAPLDGGEPSDATAGEETGVDATTGNVDAGSDASAGNDAGNVPADGSTQDGGCGGGGPGTFSCTGNLTTPRGAPGGAGLTSGEVLVAGGWNNTDKTLKTAELFDPVSGTFTATGSMAGEHLWSGWAGSWPVLSNGQVLAAGGLAASGALLGTAELYDPGTGMFSGTGGLGTPVVAYTELKLTDGSLMLVGGYSTVTVAPPMPSFQYTAGTNVAQRYDLASGMFTSAGTLAEQRLFGCNVVLPSGKVLAIGGWQGVSTTFESNIEQYDPTMNAWTTVGTLGSDVTCSANAFNLPSGKVLLDSSQLLDPGTLTTTATTNTLSITNATFVQLANGDVLAFGGQMNNALSTDAQVYENATGQWTAVGSMHQARQGSRGFLMASGDVLIVGGADKDSNVLTSAEIYHP